MKVGDESVRLAIHAACYFSTAAAQTQIATNATLMDSTWFDRGGMNKHPSIVGLGGEPAIACVPY